MTSHSTDDWRQRITAKPGLLGGKPVIRGMRISVQQIIESLAAGWTHAELLNAFPDLVEEDIRACLLYSVELVKDTHLVTNPAA